MITGVFIATTIICAVGWLTRSISCAALLYYIEKSGYKLPNDQDLDSLLKEFDGDFEIEDHFDQEHSTP